MRAAENRDCAVPLAGLPCPARLSARHQAGLRRMHGQPEAGHARRPHRQHPAGVSFPFAPEDPIVSPAAQKAAAFHPRCDLPLDPFSQDLGQDDSGQHG
jgi:hypothetical protein